MDTWNKYYDRSGYLEGVSSTFDLFGENSSFQSPTGQFSEVDYIRYSLNRSFNRSSKYLRIAMRKFKEKHEKTK